MPDNKQKLTELGAGTLADALIQLAESLPEVKDKITSLLATPDENIKRLKRKIAGIKRSNRFIDWRETRSYSLELEAVLADIQSCISEPKAGLKLTCTFYETDDSVFSRCDDSSGNFGDIYRILALDLFVHYARQMTDKKSVVKALTKLIEKDDFGVREYLVDACDQFLPQSSLEQLIDYFQQQAGAEKDAYTHRRYCRAIESLARQTKNPALFEKTRLTRDGAPHIVDLIEIAQTYFENEQPETALNWLNRYPANDTYMAYERDDLLIKIYRQLGSQEKLEALLSKRFQRIKSASNLKALLDVSGEEKRPSILQQATREIMESDHFDESNAEFLLEIEQTELALDYLLKHEPNIDGQHYYSLLRLVDQFAQRENHLAVCLLYRRLLLSILERAKTNTYSHGVRYLKKLDALSEQVDNWRGLPDHASFKQSILEQHKRKTSFWGKYKGTK